MENKELIPNTDTVENLINDGKNKYAVVCCRCPSKILNSNTAEFKEIKFSLPLMTLSKDKKDDTLEKEDLNEFWIISDKFLFENIGFSNTVSGLKYLTCADCEIGPVGWFDPDSQLCYVSISRVKYVS